MKDQLNHSEAERRHLDQQATSFKLQIDELRRQFDDTAHERDRSKTALETSNYERTNMEKIRIVSDRISFVVHRFRLVFRLSTLKSILFVGIVIVYNNRIRIFNDNEIFSTKKKKIYKRIKFVK